MKSGHRDAGLPVRFRFAVAAFLAAVSGAFAAVVAAQQLPDIGFVSVGRAAPLQDDVNRLGVVGATRRKGWHVHRRGARRRDATQRQAVAPRPVHHHRTSMPTSRCGATRDTSAATVSLPSRTSGRARPEAPSATTRRALRPWGYCDRDYPRKSHRQPLPVPDGAGALRSTACRRPGRAAGRPYTRRQRCRTNGTASIVSRGSARATTPGSRCARCRCRRCCRC